MQINVGDVFVPKSGGFEPVEVVAVVGETVQFKQLGVWAGAAPINVFIGRFKNDFMRAG